jgi:hypothetical protein
MSSDSAAAEIALASNGPVSGASKNKSFDLTNPVPV